MDLEVARLHELSFTHNSFQSEYLFISRSCHRKFLVTAVTSDCYSDPHSKVCPPPPPPSSEKLKMLKGFNMQSRLTFYVVGVSSSKFGLRAGDIKFET